MNFARIIPTLLLLMTLLCSTSRATESVTLRGSVSLPAGPVKLKDIAALEGSYAIGFADVEVASLAEKQQDTSVTAAVVRKALNEKGVNWGKLLCRGAATVKVTRLAAPASEEKAAALASPEPAPVDTSAEFNAVANPIGAIDANPAQAAAAIESSLRARLIEWIRGQVGPDVAAEDLHVAFENERDPTLARTFTGRRMEIEPLSRAVLGKLPIVIRCYQGDRVTDTLHVLAEVKVRRPVVVAKKTISRGQTMTAADLDLKPIWLDSALRAPMTEVAAVVGQRAVSQVRPGTALSVDDLAAALLVQRGQLVTVRCVSGAIVLRTVGRAEGDGAAGQVVTLRNERTRQEFQARISGPQEAVMLLEPEATAAPAKPAANPQVTP